MTDVKVSLKLQVNSVSVQVHTYGRRAKDKTIGDGASARNMKSIR